MLAVAGLVVGGVVPMTVWPVLAVVAASVVRTATRPPVDYSTPAATDTPFGQAPVHLVGQLLRGPDLVLIGVLAALALPRGRHRLRRGGAGRVVGAAVRLSDQNRPMIWSTAR